MSTSPYLFPAAEHPIVQARPRLRVREAVSGFGIALRYQERQPDPPGTPEGEWCETGHSIFILEGRIRTASTPTWWRPGRATCYTSRPGAPTATNPPWWAARRCATC